MDFLNSKLFSLSCLTVNIEIKEYIGLSFKLIFYTDHCWICNNKFGES